MNVIKKEVTSESTTASALNRPHAAFDASLKSKDLAVPCWSAEPKEFIKAACAAASTAMVTTLFLD